MWVHKTCAMKTNNNGQIRNNCGHGSSDFYTCVLIGGSYNVLMLSWINITGPQN